MDASHADDEVSGMNRASSHEWLEPSKLDPDGKIHVTGALPPRSQFRVNF